MCTLKLTDKTGITIYTHSPINEVANTNMRPDIVLWSRGTKQVVLVELTVLIEARMKEAYARKLMKYQSLEECQHNGWKA